MRAGGWKARARYLAITLGTIAAMLVAGGAGWPKHSSYDEGGGFRGTLSSR